VEKKFFSSEGEKHLVEEDDARGVLPEYRA